MLQNGYIKFAKLIYDHRGQKNGSFWVGGQLLARGGMRQPSEIMERSVTRGGGPGEGWVSYKVKSHSALHERSVHVITRNLYLNKNDFKTSKPTTLCPLKLPLLTSNLHYILLPFLMWPLQSCYGSLSKNYLLVLPSITKQNLVISQVSLSNIKMVKIPPPNLIFSRINTSSASTDIFLKTSHFCSRAMVISKYEI